jgi:predicted house-cleaning noncanonical NTP pyrophosphatase (MazG superfamily)
MLPEVLEDLGMDRADTPEIRNQMIDEYGQDKFREIVRAANQNRVPKISHRMEQLLRNKGDELTVKFCDDLIEELTDAMEVVYLKKDEIGG